MQGFVIQPIEALNIEICRIGHSKNNADREYTKKNKATIVKISLLRPALASIRLVRKTSRKDDS